MTRNPDRPAEAEIFQFGQSDALLRKVMENAAAGMALISLQRRLIYVNGAFAEMLGYETRDCLGLEMDAIIHPDCEAALALQLGRLMSGEVEDYRGECRLRHREGRAVWTLASGSALSSEQTGRPLHVILQVMSIERQKCAEAALVYSESRWNFALEAAGQGVWDHDIRRDDMFYSNQWRRMRGIPDDEYVDPAQDKWLARVHPDDVPGILATVEKQSRGEEGFETLEYRERHRAGHWIWILSRGRPVEWDENGTPIRTIGTDTDITRLKTVEAELAAQKERLRVTLESIGDGVISTDSNRVVTFMNRVAEWMTGCSSSQSVGQPLEKVFALVDEASGEPMRDPVAQCLAADTVAYFEEDVVLVARDGSRRDVRSTAAPLHATDGAVMGAVLVFQDITSSRRLQRQLAHSAMHDALTGLPNRAAFERALRAVASGVDKEQRRHSLCFIDLDHFKPVNDGAGHAAGDALLRRVAEVIRDTCRRQDLAARIGGDEFAVLLSDYPPEAAEKVAQKIVDAVAAIRFDWEGRRHVIGASAGITGIATGATDPVELMSEADAACYVAKANGRGRVEVYAPSPAAS
jgi:diguanylate cyclase